MQQALGEAGLPRDRVPPQPHGTLEKRDSLLKIAQVCVDLPQGLEELGPDLRLVSHFRFDPGGAPIQEASHGKCIASGARGDRWLERDRPERR